MSKPVRVEFKDPNAMYAADLTQEEHETIRRDYSTFGEYFKLEVDFATKTAKLLPVDEWKVS